jgi:hypothetical protein
VLTHNRTWTSESPWRRSLRNTAKSPLFNELNLLLDLESHTSVAFRGEHFVSKHRLVCGWSGPPGSVANANTRWLAPEVGGLL